MNKYIIEKLKEGRANAKLKQSEVAEKIGIKGNTLSNYENGVSEPDIDTFCALCDIYNIDPSDILNEAYGLGVQGEEFKIKPSEIEHLKRYRTLDKVGKENIEYELAKEILRVEEIKKHKKQLQNQQDHIHQLEQRIVTEVAHRFAIPLYGKFASAGDGAYLFDDIPTEKIKVLDTPTARKADFVIGVNGDSMEPDYCDGEKVFVEKTADLEIGDIGIFLKGSDCYIKELGADRLISHNKAHDDIWPDEEIRTIGKVIGKVEED